MNVKLASQLFSQSVVDALKFCNDDLNMSEFSETGVTIQFIKMFNATFDILNVRSINCKGFKETLNKDNIKNISNFTEKITNYIKGFKMRESGGFVPVLESNKTTGFVEELHSS